MEVKVKLGFDDNAEGLLTALVGALDRLLKASEGTCDCPNSPEILKPVEVVYEEPKEVAKVDYEKLHAEIHSKAVGLAKAGKREEVKALTAKFGKEAISQLENDQLEEYMAELEKIA